MYNFTYFYVLKWPICSDCAHLYNVHDSILNIVYGFFLKHKWQFSKHSDMHFYYVFASCSLVLKAQSFLIIFFFILCTITWVDVCSFCLAYTCYRYSARNCLCASKTLKCMNKSDTIDFPCKVQWTLLWPQRPTAGDGSTMITQGSARLARRHLVPN